MRRDICYRASEDARVRFDAMRGRAEVAERERDELAANGSRLRRELEACQSLLHSLAHSGDVTPQYANDAKAVLKETPAASLAAHDVKVAADAMRAVSDWMDPESDSYGGPGMMAYEMIGMEISGPTHCSSVHQCNKAGMRAFREAARIWEHQAKERGES